MAAKLREKDGAYWVVVHHNGRRTWKKIGKDKRQAQKVVHKVNAQIALGKLSMEGKRTTPTVEEALLRWYEDYKPTFSPSFAQVADLNIHSHLIPFFGAMKLSEVDERHLLQFIREKTEQPTKPLKASTILNILSLLRRVAALAVENGELPRNPCRNLGKLLAKVRRQQSEEVAHVDSWSREEVATLLEVAQTEEPGFYPLLAFLVSTGCRKGEALALKWEDLDFSASRVLIRRALVRGRLGTPKSGKGRSVVLSPAPGPDPARSPHTAPSSVPEQRLARRARVRLLLRDGWPAGRAKRDPFLAPDTTQGAEEGCPPPAPPRRPAHIRFFGPGLGEVGALGRVAARTREPRADTPSLRTRSEGRGSRPELPRLWRHQTAPPRHQASGRLRNEKAPSRNSAKGLQKPGARDRARTGDPHVGKAHRGPEKC
jgi:integrase